MAVRGTVDAGAGGTLVTSVTGTANEVTVSPTTGATVVSLPSAITLTGKTLTGGSFVTPALGTPASGVGTNITGIIYSNVTAAPTFTGTRITSAFTVTSGVTTKVQLNNSRIDNAAYWDGTNFYYKPLIAGTYEVSGSVYIQATTVTAVTLSISKNGTSGGSGTEVCEVTINPITTAAAQSAALPASFIAMNGSTDTLELDVTASGTGTVNVSQLRSTSQMSIKWVGP